MSLKCIHCNAELGLRERYERQLDLLQACLVVFKANENFEQTPDNKDRAREVMQASVQLHKIIKQYWDDIPGETLQAKLDAVDAKRELEKGEDGKYRPKQVSEEIILCS